ncbi:putative leucine-rich repeat-containing protein DDB_G0290503 [Linepithema humile]|uniref:putative leucine-rich repeat-containing protein DDB_G0290503 n=1 Tax=Linepithema humile TaxID=83485 RepID=UPI00351E6237
MPQAKKHDEQEALKLDEHFKQILTHVRPYVLNLTSVDEAYLCKIWLDKLNSTISQRNLRNEYLLELSRQLRAGILEGIFKTRPPNDLLIPLPSPCHTVYINSSLSELSDSSRSYQKCLSLNEKLNQRNHQLNEINVYDDSAIEKNHSKLCEHRIDILTAALQNLRIENVQLRGELTKYQEKSVDNKPFRLQNRVKQLTAQTQIQNLGWKVRVLKKTITKLKKLNKITKHVYEKKLQHLMKNKNLEIKVLQLQFQGQMSEFCLSLCAEKQNELHSLVGALEEKYRALLTAADATIENQRQEYFMKIAVLEAKLCQLKNFEPKAECV